MVIQTNGESYELWILQTSDATPHVIVYSLVVHCTADMGLAEVTLTDVHFRCLSDQHEEYRSPTQVANSCQTDAVASTVTDTLQL